ncbi:GNAT family N-acetyltransferase [Paenibacillus filicis]|uniref:GNAT family N-acetyltransferase n=1 Tax=Paenibacillus filicis TaxID=669464 RepID=A0ABU9DFI2_9BACL
MTLFQSENLKLRYLAEDDDVRLSRWLSDPEVLQYYEGRDRPLDLELVRKHFYEDRDGVTACIIQYQGQDIGYIQFYPLEEDERSEYGYGDDHEIIYGMDQFIGDPAYWNKGIGTELITAMAAYLTDKMKADTIVMDPQAWNERAIHVYEKCGFVKKKLLPLHEWHEGEYRDCWLIEYKGADRR